MLEKFRRNNELQIDLQVVRPPVDIYETEKEIVLNLDMPGAGKETLNVELQGNNLTIHGFKKKDQIEEKYHVLYSERNTAVEYQRVFQLNSEVDREKISANYQNGVLKLVLVKSQEALPQKIAVV